MNSIHILIPVYKEAAIIKSCVEYFNKLAQYPGVLIHYVTTEKEGENSDTVAALNQMLERYSFSHLHYPETTGIKAHQLNWAIKHILATYKSTEYQTTYFGIYDVDSRPEAEVIKTILYGKDAIYQQPSIYLENYGRIGALQKAGALLQTKWELCGNIPALREYESCIQHKQSVSTLPCCTGHGIFIRADILEQIGLFDTVTLSEDLEFGYRSVFRKIPITLLKEVDYTQYAPTLLATIRQTSRWFSAEMDLYRYYRNEKKGSKKGELKNRLFRLLVLKRYQTTLKWAFGAPLIYLAFLVLILRYPLTILLAVLSVFLYVYVPFRMIGNFTSWTKDIGDRKNLFALFLSGCIRPLLNSFGPFHYFVTAPFNIILRKPRTFVRTPKN